MMVPDNFIQVGKSLKRAHDIFAHNRMNLGHFLLGFAQADSFQQYCFGQGELANVVQQSEKLNVPKFILTQTDFFCQQQDVTGHTRRMRRKIFVPGFNRGKQGLNRIHHKRNHIGLQGLEGNPRL